MLSDPGSCCCIADDPGSGLGFGFFNTTLGRLDCAHDPGSYGHAVEKTTRGRMGSERPRSHWRTNDPGSSGCLATTIPGRLVLKWGCTRDGRPGVVIQEQHDPGSCGIGGDLGVLLQDDKAQR